MIPICMRINNNSIWIRMFTFEAWERTSKSRNDYASFTRIPAQCNTKVV